MSSLKKQSKSFSIYRDVTDRIIQALEKDCPPWIKPWKTEGRGGLPRNFCTNKYYSGINVLLLWLSSELNGFSSNYYATFKQFSSKGLKILRGSSANRIVYVNKYKKIIETKKTDGTISVEEKNIPFLKYYSVFNLEQTDYTFPEDEPIKISGDFSSVKEYISNVPVKIIFSGDRAYYDRSNYIKIPPKSKFTSASAFYSTIIHELIHWTGHESHLNREKNKGYNERRYSFEELIAELGAAFLSAELKIDGKLQHDSYIQSWLEYLKNDQKYIFKATKFASQAVEYLNQLQPQRTSN
jgi:antirestriction protein ArdC